MYSVVVQDMNEILKMNCDIDFNILKDKTFFVTGANGMIASYFVSFLLYLNDNLNLNIHIVGLIREPKKLCKCFTNALERGEFSLCVHDICEEIKWDGKIDYILHAASPTSPAMFRQSPVEVIRANSVGTLNTLDFAKRNNATVLFLSTREIYGKQYSDSSFVSENDLGLLDCGEVRSCYPESKRLAENICVSYTHEYNIATKIARIAHTYGPGMPIGDGRVMSDFLKNVINSENIVLNSDGSTMLALTYISDIIAGLIRFLLKSDAKIRNISSDGSILSVKELAETLCKIFPERRMSVQFKTISSSERQGYLQYKIPFLSSKKLYDEGWNPRIGIEEGLKRTVSYYEGGIF